MSKEFWHDDLTMDAGWILTKEEFQSEVEFDISLLDSLSSRDSSDDESLWFSMNDNDGFIQQGYPGKKASHAITFKTNPGKGTVIVLFGELLIHVDTTNRLQWKEYFKNTNCTINIAEKLLFPQTDEDYSFCRNYWNKRRKDYNDENDLPWMTPGEHDQIQEELRYLKDTWDEEIGMTQDMKFLVFNSIVLEKYKMKPHCKLNISNSNLCIISFLNYAGEELLSSEFFFKNPSTIMMYTKDFVFIPIRERDHWKQFII